MAFIANWLGFGGASDNDGALTSAGVLYQLNEHAGWTCVLPLCKLVATQRELEGFVITVCDQDGTSADDMRLRAQQMRLILPCDGPLNSGVQFSVVGGGTFLFECAEGQSAGEDAVVSAMLRLGEKQREAEQEHAEELASLSSLSPVSRGECGDDLDVAAHGELYLWRNGAHCLLLQSITLKLTQRGEHDFFVCLDGPGFFWAQPVSEAMQMEYSSGANCFLWLCTVSSPTGDGMLLAWKVKVLDGQAGAFQHKFIEALYETKTQESFTKKVKADDREWFYESMRADPTDIPESDDEVEECEMILEDELENDENTSRAFSSAGINTCLAVSTMERNDRSFVSRGNEIGVFKTNPEGVKYAATIRARLNNDEIRPGQIMMHDQDNKMILVDPERLTRLYCMDVETETIVDEWKTNEHGFKVRSVLPEEKYAQQQPKQTFVGVNESAAFLIDPRLRDEKQAAEYGFQMAFATNPQITCAATTGKGEFVTGSRTGDIRLMDSKTFHEINTNDRRRRRAKTQLPGYGDPIIGIDVTEDGKWVLATCEKYLLVVSTEIDPETTGFQKSMGKHKKAPLKLRLKPQDVAAVGKVSFTPARFNTRHVTHASGEIERTIVTSTGNFVITWNFRHVKKGRLQEYQMRQYAEDVITDQFMTGQDRSVVVALPGDVKLATRKVVKNFGDDD